MTSGPHAIFVAHAGEIPHLLQEIGRLREIAFRAAGEGTGTATDLDEFDPHYLHLVLWHAGREEVVGAYRMGPTDAIVARFGADGLYTSTLFEFRSELLARLNPALELGRSFVRVEQQRSYAPLLLLWKGIGRFVARHPQYRTVFGAVSISNEYRAASQRLIVHFLSERLLLSSLSRFVRARRPVTLPPEHARALRDELPPEADLADLDGRIAALEGSERGVPVLLRQYTKLGGRFLAFNRDRSFANAIDALVAIDLLGVERPLLERLFGTDGVRSFEEFHHERYTPACPLAAFAAT